MVLFIRSKSKKQILKVNSVSITENTKVEKNDLNNLYARKRMIYTIFVNSCPFGDYETEKRALEILDEVQALLSGKGNKKSKTNNETEETGAILFYQMPEK